jgi:hypothetical protein
MNWNRRGFIPFVVNDFSHQHYVVAFMVHLTKHVLCQDVGGIFFQLAIGEFNLVYASSWFRRGAMAKRAQCETANEMSGRELA